MKILRAIPTLFIVLTISCDLIAQTDGQDIITKSGVTLNNTTVYARQKVRIINGTKLRTGTKLTVNNDLYYESLPYQVVDENLANSAIKGYNFIFTQVFRKEGVNLANLSTGSNADVVESVKYYDGLGRPLQIVDLKAGPNNENIYIPIEYNNAGLEEKKYLPFALNADGQYRTSATTDVADYYSSSSVPGHTSNTGAAYTFVDYEESTLARVVSQSGPGSEFSGKAVTFSYGSNISPVRKWGVDSNGNLEETGTYATGTLFMTKTTDENLNAVIEYKDKSGRVVLKVGEMGTQTFYIYDGLGRLRYVLPPKALEQYDTYSDPSVLDIFYTVANLGYSYDYDGRGRMIGKRLPGAEPIFMVYDKMDRLVMMQDGNMFSLGTPSTNKWLYTCYDKFGRPVKTGLLYNCPLTCQEMQDFYNNSAVYYETTTNTNYNTQFGYTISTLPTGYTSDVLSVTYYDNYDYNRNGSPDKVYFSETGYSSTTITNQKGLSTGSKTKVITNDGTTKYIESAVFYDAYGRPKQNQVVDQLGVTETTTSELNLIGEVQKQKTSYNGILAGKSNEEKFTYDQRGRLLSVKQSLDNGNEVLLTSNTYNALGELVKEAHKPNTLDALQYIDYTYNIRGWLTGINPVNTPGHNDLFNMKLYYTEAMPNLSTQKQYNGNISGIAWRTAQDPANIWQAYGYTYDKLNRLTNAFFAAYTGSSNTITPSTSNYLLQYEGQFNEFGLTYDANGNITNLKRNGIYAVDGAVTYFGSSPVDILAYDYLSTDGLYSNKLLNVTDNHAIDIPQNSNTGNFIDGNTTTTDDYAYDKNGNLIKDLNKGIAEIQYNILNLPQKVIFTAGQKFIDYIYTAAGALVQKKVTDGGVLQYTENYLGAYTYKTMGTNTFNANDLSYITTAKGRWVKNGNNYVHEFYLKDHLGNTRVVYSDDNNDCAINTTTEVKQYASYYPFGLLHNRYSTVTDDNRKLYNGKEFQSDLNLDWYDYRYRFYNPQIARFNSIDRLADKYPYKSPYDYAENRPIDGFDLDGLEWTPAAMSGVYSPIQAANSLKQMKVDPKSQAIGSKMFAATFAIAGGASAVYAGAAWIAASGTTASMLGGSFSMSVGTSKIINGVRTTAAVVNGQPDESPKYGTYMGGIVESATGSEKAAQYADLITDLATSFLGAPTTPGFDLIGTVDAVVTTGQLVSQVVSDVSTSNNSTTYQIKNGDTLSSIAQGNNTTVEALTNVNQLSDPNKIQAGQTLIIQ